MDFKSKCPHPRANIQIDDTKEEKKRVKKILKLLLLHGDFAENLKVIIKTSVQSANWINDQVSILTTVCYQGAEVRSFAIVSDGTKHDSAYALLSMDFILEHFRKISKCVFPQEITIATGGAACHLKKTLSILRIDLIIKRKKIGFILQPVTVKELVMELVALSSIMLLYII